MTARGAIVQPEEAGLLSELEDGRVFAVLPAVGSQIYSSGGKGGKQNRQ